jgi:hypothetical protein
MLQVATLERPMILAVSSRLNPISSGNSTTCAKRNSFAVCADLNRLRAASIHSNPLASRAIIASCSHRTIIADYLKIIHSFIYLF